MKTNVISILDKEFPPSHSFVDGMLSRVLPNEDFKVTLVVSKDKANKEVRKYKKSKCYSILYPRRGIKRFLNFFVLYFFLLGIIKQNKKKDERVVLFVRNEPIHLLAASLLRDKVNKLIFQQSFPHEKGSGNRIKKRITLLIFKLAKNKVDGLITVSPKGLKRLQCYFPNSINNMYIPLLTNRAELINRDDIKEVNQSETINFLYIGTHASSRKLDVVLEGIVKSLSQGVQATFTFIGGNEQEVQVLRDFVNISKYEQYGKIKFISKIPRDQLLNQLNQYDVGLTIIPNNDLYSESSPTKLVEYMSKGLMVIGSKGIELQELFINESKGGQLVDFTSEAIQDSINKVCGDKLLLNKMKLNALKFTEENLLYENYVEDLRNLL